MGVKKEIIKVYRLYGTVGKLFFDLRNTSQNTELFTFRRLWRLTPDIRTVRAATVLNWGLCSSTCVYLRFTKSLQRRSQWPRGLRRRSTAARLRRLWVRIPLGAWTFVCCEYCVLSGRGLCDELITRPEESYRLWCVVLCDLETSKEEAKAR